MTEPLLIVINKESINSISCPTWRTDTGRTVTLQVLAERFSAIGNPLVRGIMGSLHSRRR